ncbi:MAG: helix-turn-helix transcriptional regulator [Azospirillaceae bacterium]|nr:helix-turn-helix transcriptional regulator [Azospirillaceae bacterium]
MTVTLTFREAECLRLLAEGEGVKHIAFELGIKPKSVDAYLLRARRKLGAKTSTHAVAVAMSMGLLKP